MLEKIRRGEKILNLPKGLESYQDLCSRLRGIGHVPSAVEESIQWKTLFNKHEIVVREIKRLETVVKTHEEKLERIRNSKRACGQAKHARPSWQIQNRTANFGRRRKEEETKQAK
jgi:hypothetical protein